MAELIFGGLDKERFLLAGINFGGWTAFILVVFDIGDIYQILIQPIWKILLPAKIYNFTVDVFYTYIYCTS